MKQVTFKAQVGDLQALRDIGFAADTDPSRPLLCAVRIEVTPKLIYLVATNSYLMAVRAIELEEPVAPDACFSFEVPSKALTEAAKAGIKSPRGYVLVDREITLSDGGVEIQTYSGSVSVSRLKEDLPHPYPDWRKLLEPMVARQAPCEHVAVIPDFVAQLGKALTAERIQVEFSATDRSRPGVAPLLVAPIQKPDDTRSFGILMPVRDEWKPKEESVPEVSNVTGPVITRVPAPPKKRRRILGRKAAA